MKLNNYIRCTILLLFLAAFCTGIAAAESPTEIVADPVADFPAMVYVSGTTVTIELNHNLPADSPNYYYADYYEVKGPKSNEKVYYRGGSSSNIDVIQFDVNATGDYLVHLCGYYNQSSYFSASNNRDNHRGQYFTFNVDEIIDEEGKSKLVVYPSDSYFAYWCDNKTAIYHTSEYSQLFNNGLYPDLMNTLADNNVLYSFYGNNLSSISWYSETDAVTLTGDKTVNTSTSSNSNFNSWKKKVISAYKPEINVNMSNIPEFEINYLYICEDHYLTVINKAGNDYISIHDCNHDIEWNALVNNVSKDGSEYSLKTFFEKFTNYFDDEEETVTELVDYPHYVSFSNMNALSEDLMNSREVSFAIYPSVAVDSDPVTPPIVSTMVTMPLTNSEETEYIDYKGAAISFSFKRLAQNSVTIVPVINEEGQINIVVKNELDSPSEPVLSGMSFPGDAEYLDVLEGASLIVENLNEQVVRNVESDLITEDTHIYSVMNIDFGDKKADINKALADNNGNVTLEFEVPVTDFEGNSVNGDELTVFHISESGGSAELEELKIIGSPIKKGDAEFGYYYVVTVNTTSFSAFAVASTEEIETPETPAVSASSSGKHIVIIPEEDNATNGSNSSAYERNITAPLPPIVQEIIEVVQGHLSIFSILVVLTSGLFMWSYIRRRI